MNRFVAYLLLTAFLQLQGATCCHCAQGLVGDSNAESPATCHHDSAVPHSHNADRTCPLQGSNDDDAFPITPPCGPDHGGHLCVISHLGFINSNTPYEFNLATTVLNVDFPLSDQLGIAAALDGNVTNVLDSTTTLLDCHTLLRI